MEHDENASDSGPSRREILRRSALVGGTVVWMAPAVQTLAAPAFAGVGSEAPGNGDFESSYSEILVLVECNNVLYRVKFEPNNAGSVGNLPAAECGSTFNFGGCKSDDFFRNDVGVSAGCSSVSAVINADGSVVVSAGAGCTINAYATHKGKCCTYNRAAGTAASQNAIAPGLYNASGAYTGVTVGAASSSATFSANPPNDC